MTIIGFEKISLVNFDNEVSATIFLNGCNFRCPFCHNFEFVVPTGEDFKIYSEDEILDYLKKRSSLLSAVVISGGEPTCSKDLKDLITKIKALGYKIKLDSNGSNPDTVINLFEEGLIDYVAIDIKNSIKEYGNTIGLKNYNTSSVEKMVNYLINGSYDYEFRTTLIDGYHTTESIKDMALWIKGAKRLFLQKFEDSEYVPNKTLKPVEKKNALEFKRILDEYIDNVSLRGYED